MAKHQWSVLCRRCIIDREDNSISLIEALEEMTVLGAIPNEVINENITRAKGPPSSGLQLVTLWIRTDKDKPEKCQARLEVKAPNNKKIITFNFEVDLTEKSRHRTKIQFPAIPFGGGPGVYTYLVKLNKGTEKKPKWSNASELYLDLKITSGEN